MAWITPSKARVDVHHWYHVYADGQWQTPVEEHIRALTEYGLRDVLTTLNVGFVGEPANVRRAMDFIAERTPFVAIAVAATGWEQVTLSHLWSRMPFYHGLVSYAHTKGAANYAEVNDAWRRSMEYHNFVRWERPAELLADHGMKAAGCHWHTGAWSARGDGVSGMFGGNYWWARCDALRRNCPPDNSNRWAAEHWVGQLSEVMAFTPGVDFADLNSNPIGQDFDPW